MSKKVLMVVAPTGFRDEEFLEPKEVLEKNNIEVIVCSKDTDLAEGKFDTIASVDIDITKAKADDYDALIFIGGPGAKIYFEDPTAQNLASKMASAGKVVAAICVAPSILANAGILSGKHATSFPTEKDNIESKSAGYTGDPVTVAGKIVTANGPEAATRFGEEIVKLLDDKEEDTQ